MSNKIEDRIEALLAIASQALGQETRSRETESEYRKIARRVLSETDNLATLSPEKMRKRSWFKLRAALRFAIATRIGLKIRLFNKIDGDHLEAPGECQVYDIRRFEDVRETEIRKLFASSISPSN